MKSNYISIVLMSVVLSSSFLVLACTTQVESANSTPPGPSLSDVQLVEAMENVFVDIAHRSKPAIVSITATNVKHGTEQKPDQHGSGFIFRKDGYIATNNHVINGAKLIRVRIFDNRKFIAKLVGGDAGTDIAVLKLRPIKNYQRYLSPTQTVSRSDNLPSLSGIHSDWIIPLQPESSAQKGVLCSPIPAN